MTCQLSIKTQMGIRSVHLGALSSTDWETHAEISLVCGAAVYMVGDSQGWTIINNPNYSRWAASKSFHNGDVIVFQYNKEFNNVMQVTLADFKSCNAVNPLATYNSGNDTITIQKPGHYFYLCSFPGHCEAGQRVDIRVPKTQLPMSPSSSAVPTISPSPSPTPSHMPLAPSPAKSSASSFGPPSIDTSAKLWIWLATFVPAVFVGAFLG
ncbi:hypothetical protein Nepgr_027888 [Nepenthes gracilis]|uniref:Phytocyanin domain-containing protein n=1 Tax=Nepenthes gracilis TaxID=150966 RepID=A0AAD3T9B5_NEPGR|nr:hypothetical protein Nepgr_027888 [Nepenthes gracilis]